MAISENVSKESTQLFRFEHQCLDHTCLNFYVKI